MTQNETTCSDYTDQFGHKSSPFTDRLSELDMNSNYYEIEQLIQCHEVKKSFEYIAIHINIQSAPKKFNDLKTLVIRLSMVGIQVDFILLCETFFTDLNVAQYKIPGYKLVPVNRKTITKGGVAIYIKQDFVYKERDDLSDYHEGEFEAAFVEIKDMNKTLIVGEIYRVPNTNENAALTRYEAVLERIHDNKPSLCIIGTDQNFDYMKINKHNNTLNLFNNFLTAGMIPTITKPTRITHKTATLIDNIYVTCNINKIFSAILLSDMSDHLPCLTCIGTKPQKPTKSLQFKYRPINEQIMDRIKNELANTDWNFMHVLSSNDSYKSLVMKINEVIEKYAPEKLITIPSKRIFKDPWMTSGIMQSCIKRDQLYKKCIGKPKEHINTIKFTKYRNILNTIKKTAKNNYYRNLLATYKNDMKKTWGVVNSLIGRNNDKSNLPEIFKHEDKTITDRTQIANEFCNFFNEIGMKYSAAIPPPKCQYHQYLGTSQNTRSIFLSPTDCNEIINIMKSLKSKSSSGPDGISGKFLKQIGSEIVVPLVIIINKSLSEGFVPDELKIAKVIPVYKSKDKTSFNNYRPISLLPSLSKILEKVVHKRLYNFLEINKLFYPSQYGFRPKHSTINAVTEFTYDTLLSFEKLEETLAVFLDLSKAFDTATKVKFLWNTRSCLGLVQKLPE